MKYIKSLNGLQAYWPLDETDGVNSLNIAPATIGTLNGAASGVLVNQPGAVNMGKSYYYDGVNDVSTVTASATLQLQTQSIGAIIIPDNTVPQDTFIYGGNANGAFGMKLTNTNKIRLDKQGSGTLATATTSMTNGAAYTVGATYNSATGAWAAYVGGVLDGSGTNSQTFTYSGDHNIGAGTAGSFCFKGYLQHLFITNKVMTLANFQEIRKIAGV